MILLFTLRLLAIILIFAPALGLFDTMHHGILATVLVKNGNLTFDYDDNGSPISFEEAWGQFKVEDSSVYSNVYKIVSPLLLLVVFIFHLFAGVLLQNMFTILIKEQ